MAGTSAGAKKGWATRGKKGHINGVTGKVTGTGKMRTSKMYRVDIKNPGATRSHYQYYNNPKKNRSVVDAAKAYSSWKGQKIKVSVPKYLGDIR